MIISCHGASTIICHCIESHWNVYSPDLSIVTVLSFIVTCAFEVDTHPSVKYIDSDQLTIFAVLISQNAIIHIHSINTVVKYLDRFKFCFIKLSR